VLYDCYDLVVPELISYFLCFVTNVYLLTVFIFCKTL